MLKNVLPTVQIPLVIYYLSIKLQKLMFELKSHHFQQRMALCFHHIHIQPGEKSYIIACVCNLFALISMVQATDLSFLFLGRKSSKARLKTAFILSIQWILYDANGLGGLGLSKCLLIIHPLMGNWPVWNIVHCH